MSSGWRALVLLLIVPILAYFVADWAHGKYESTWQDVLACEYPNTTSYQRQQFTLDVACQRPETSGESICNDIQRLKWMKDGSIAVGGLAIFLLAGIAWAGSRAEGDREELLRLFKPGVHVTLWALVALVTLEAVLAIGVVFYGEQAAIDRVHPFVILGIGVGAALAVVAVVRASLAVLHDDPLSIIGLSLDAKSHQQLWTAVTQLAHSIGTRPPDNIIAGLQPNFFVTEQPVRCLNAVLQRRTMYISLPLCRILDCEEFLAVVAHELAHFRGEDTRYSVEFYPIYRRTGDALSAIDAGNAGCSRLIGILPAAITLSYFISRFATAERKIGREREFEADRVAALETGGEEVARALFKTAASAPLWQAVQNSALQVVREGKYYPNLSAVFVDRVSASSTTSLIKTALNSDIPHPIDTHPPLPERIKSLGFDIGDLFQDLQGEALQMPTGPAITYFPNGQELEGELSIAEQTVYRNMIAAQQQSDATSS